MACYDRQNINLITDIKAANGGGKKLSDDERLAVANGIADDHIEISKYKLVVTEGSLDNHKVFYYDYFREINGHKTSDGLSIALWEDDSAFEHGCISSVKLYMPGGFENADC